MSVGGWFFARDPFRTWVWVRVIFSTATLVVIVGYLGFADGETVGDGGLRMLAFTGPWWLMPVAIYFGFTRTLFVLVCVGTGLFAATFLALPAVFDDWHSTAGVALLFWPVYFVALIGAYLMLESVGLNLFERFRRGRQQ